MFSTSHLINLFVLKEQRVFALARKMRTVFAAKLWFMMCRDWMRMSWASRGRKWSLPSSRVLCALPSLSELNEAGSSKRTFCPARRGVSEELQCVQRVKTSVGIVVHLTHGMVTRLDGEKPRSANKHIARCSRAFEQAANLPGESPWCAACSAFAQICHAMLLLSWCVMRVWSSTHDLQLSPMRMSSPSAHLLKLIPQSCALHCSWFTRSISCTM